ncbi:MAG: four helix bundle protein [Candidatus Omnitrophota bacterium]|jgi:four helix bundle protein
MDVPNYRKLVAWQKAHKNALLLIEILKNCSSKFSGIVIQCLNSATSIGANIAEGNAVRSDRQKSSYFEIALNSGYELDNWLQILKDSGLICSDKKALLDIENRNIEVIKILTKLIFLNS